MSIAASMLSGNANAGIKPLSLDGKINRAAPQVHQWTVAGTIGVLKDQTPFYNLLTDDLEGTNVAGVPTFASSTKYTAASATRYIADNLAPLRMMHFTGVAGTNSATVLETMKLLFKRFTPDGAAQTEQVLLSTFVTPNRFQTGVLSVPINGEVLDGYTYPIVVNDEGSAVAVAYTVSFAFGATNDPRADVPAARPAVVTAPGQA